LALFNRSPTVWTLQKTIDFSVIRISAIAVTMFPWNSACCAWTCPAGQWETLVPVLRRVFSLPAMLDGS